MIEFVKNTGKQNLILFVHGFTGGSETWRNPQHGYFYDHLIANPVISDNFDIAKFEYFSKLLNLFASVGGKFERFKSLFTSKITRSEKNLGISELGELLSTELRFKLKNYENIVIVAHSMGGLIAKQCIINDIQIHDHSKVKLMISLAVPHLGSDIATYSALLSGNLQITDLKPLGKICPHLNDQWLKLEARPEIKYFYGTYDDVVKKQSAVGTESIIQDVIACNEDHTSICKPNGPESTAVIAVTHFLEELLNTFGPAEFVVHKLSDGSQFADEYFALKLLLAEVHEATVKHSKEHFLNAEYVRKMFSSSADQKKLADLYIKIRTIYQDCYDKQASTGKVVGGALVADVHQKIVSEDSHYLKSALPLLQALHKKGMLHQLANDLDDDIWWNDNRSLETLHGMKSEAEKG